MSSHYVLQFQAHTQQEVHGAVLRRLVCGVGAEEVQVVLNALQVGALEVYIVALCCPPGAGRQVTAQRLSVPAKSSSIPLYR